MSAVLIANVSRERKPNVEKGGAEKGDVLAAITVKWMLIGSELSKCDGGNRTVGPFGWAVNEQNSLGSGM